MVGLCWTVDCMSCGRRDSRFVRYCSALEFVVMKWNNGRFDSGIVKCSSHRID